MKKCKRNKHVYRFEMWPLVGPRAVLVSVQRWRWLMWRFVSQVIFSACELGVFDLLLTSPEPLSAQSVAQELGASVDGMERLLDALVGIEILEVETADGTGEEEEEDEVALSASSGLQ